MYKRRVLVGVILGGALAAAIFAWHDFDSVLSAAGLVGAGFALVVGWRFVALALMALAWRPLFAPPDRPRFPALLLARWVGEAVNSLLPVAQVGGDVARARILLRWPASGGGAVPLLAAIATIVADMTLNLVGQFALALIGAWHLWRTSQGDALQLAAACAVAFLPLALLLFAQRPAILDRVHRRFAHWLGAAHGSAPKGGLGERIAGMYARSHAVAGALVLHLLAALCRAMEVWIILNLMDVPAGLMDAIMIEGLSSALRTAAFLLPAGLGIQEGALLVLCGWIGIPPSQALALALIKRGREIAVGLGGLAIWLLVERPRMRAS